MIGELSERFEIHKSDSTLDSGGESTSYSKQDTVWGQAMSADSAVIDRFDSLDSKITYVIKLANNPTLEYDDYKLKRVGDGQWFVPESPPITSGKFNRVTFVGVRNE